MYAIDLFCGCGGFTTGFEQEGFCVLGIDIWDTCLKSHNGNTLQLDIYDLTRNRLPKQFQKPLVVFGSPPCQTFSTANLDTRTKDDSLIKEFNRVVLELNPQYWIWENVMGSRCVSKGLVIDAQYFGVPQRRKRNFVSNFLTTELLDKHKKPKVTVRDTIPDPSGSGLLDGYNSKIYSLDDVSPTIRRIPLKWYDGRYDETGMPSPLRFTGFPMLTIPEHLTLMGFSETTTLHGTKTAKMIQIGNAVAPPVASVIAKIIKEDLLCTS